MRKELYKGFDEEKISGMSLDDFAKLVTSRERRTILRMKDNPQFKKLVQKVRKLCKDGKKPSKMIRTHSREAVIIPEWLGLTFGIYNGKEFKKVTITLSHLGKRLGDFAHSTGRVLHSGPGVGATRGSKFVPIK